MAGIKISNLPAIVTPALADIFPVVQGGITYKETVTQLQTLLALNSVSIAGLQNQSYTFGTDSGAADVYVLTVSPAVAAYTTGLAIEVLISNTNTIGAPTMNVSGLGARTIVNSYGGTMPIGSLRANSVYRMIFDGTRFRMESPSPVAPTQQRLTAGVAATYTTPAGALYLRVRVVGGGGGGGGSSNGGGAGAAGGTGGTTSFGAALLACTGGTGGAASTGTTGGAGGTATVSAPAYGFANTGNNGSNTGESQSVINTYEFVGGNGGCSPFGGSGIGGNIGPSAGIAAVANSGSGGGGGGAPAGNGCQTGRGGGSGGYLEAVISAPSATYAYTIGAAGTAGTLGVGGAAGGAGGSGYIVVDEFYQ